MHLQELFRLKFTNAGERTYVTDRTAFDLCRCPLLRRSSLMAVMISVPVSRFPSFNFSIFRPGVVRHQAQRVAEETRLGKVRRPPTSSLHDSEKAGGRFVLRVVVPSSRQVPTQWDSIQSYPTLQL